MISNICLYKEYILKMWKLFLELIFIIVWVGFCSWLMFMLKKIYVFMCFGNIKDVLNLVKSFGKFLGFLFD